jgi:hypothetical protein
MMAIVIKRGEAAAMGIKTTWGDDAHTYIVVKYEVPWTWDEYHAAGDEIVEMTRIEDKRPVDVILDASTAPYPPSPAALQHFQRAWEKLAPIVGLVVIVGAGGFFQRVGTTFVRVFAKKEVMQFVETRAEADRIMRERAQASKQLPSQ